MQLKAIIDALANCSGTITVQDGIACLPDGTSVNLTAASAAITVVEDSLGLLLADVESSQCDVAAYGMPVENEDHPFYESVLQAREAQARLANV